MNNLTIRQEIKLSTSVGSIVKNSFSIDWDLKVGFFVSNQKLYSFNIVSNEVFIFII